MMMLENKYEIGDTVYLKTDDEQKSRLVIAFTVYKAGEIMYKLIAGTIVSDHYDFEITEVKNVLV